MLRAEARIIRRGLRRIAVGLFLTGLFMGLALASAAPITSRGGWSLTFIVLACVSMVVAVHGWWMVSGLRLTPKR